MAITQPGPNKPIQTPETVTEDIVLDKTEVGFKNKMGRTRYGKKITPSMLAFAKFQVEIVTPVVAAAAAAAFLSPANWHTT